jgi:hypothetical protein
VLDEQATPRIVSAAIVSVLTEWLDVMGLSLVASDDDWVTKLSDGRSILGRIDDRSNGVQHDDEVVPLM